MTLSSYRRAGNVSHSSTRSRCRSHSSRLLKLEQRGTRIRQLGLDPGHAPSLLLLAAARLLLDKIIRELVA